MEIVQKLEEIQILLISRYKKVPMDLIETIHQIKNWVYMQEVDENGKN